MRLHILLSSLLGLAITVTCLESVRAAFQAEERSAQDRPVPTDRPIAVDRVELRQGITETTKIGVWNPLKMLTFEGQIESLDSKSLTIQVIVAGKPTPKTLPSEQVQKIVPSWRSTELAETIALLDQQKIAEFSQAYPKLNYKNIPEWQQKILLVRIIQARVAANQIPQAGDSFIRLATEHSIPDLFYAEMPLCWTVAQSDDAIKQAKVWIKQESAEAKLLGASWLLMTQDSKVARSTLSELEKSQSLVIAQLAKAQLWRSSAVPDTMEQLPTWIAERDRMLPPLALGPTEFMMDRLMRIEQYDLAVGCAARIAAMHGDSNFRARRALQTASQILKRAQRIDESEKVLSWIKKLDGTN